MSHPGVEMEGGKARRLHSRSLISIALVVFLAACNVYFSMSGAKCLARGTVVTRSTNVTVSDNDDNNDDDDQQQQQVPPSTMQSTSNASLASKVKSQSPLRQNKDPKLDFYIAGHPKTCTTTMLDEFRKINETFIHPRESCLLTTSFADSVVYKKLVAMLNNTDMPPSSIEQRGIKCPHGLGFTPNAVRRLEEWFPNVKLIFGLRHPITFFRSFYNYRVMHNAAQNKMSQLPPAETLVGDTQFRGVGTLTARFERHLIRLQRPTTSGTTPEWMPFPVLLYHAEQMANETESTILRETLTSFLDLKKTIPPFRHVNSGRHYTNASIDICDSKYNDVRKELVTNGNQTQRWIKEVLMTNPNVHVVNKESFFDLLGKWSIDPCAAKREAN